MTKIQDIAQPITAEQLISARERAKNGVIWKIRQEIERRYKEFDGKTGDIATASRLAYLDVLSFLDTLKETPTWVNRAEQRQKDQAAGRWIAIMEIRTEIERLKERAAAERVLHPKTILAAKNYLLIKDYDNILAFLDILLEQPVNEEKFRNLLDAVGDCGFSQDEVLLLKSIWNDENAVDGKVVKELSEKVSSEITRQVEDDLAKQPASEDLEEELKRMVYDAIYDLDGPAIIGTSKYLSVEDVANIARHFYELGCRRTAEKYDEIEYNRQRAEESENEDLEEEIAGMYQALFGTDTINRKEMLYLETFHNIARHFAEWGAKNAK